MATGEEKHFLYLACDPRLPIMVNEEPLVTEMKKTCPKKKLITVCPLTVCFKLYPSIHMLEHHSACSGISHTHS